MTADQLERETNYCVVMALANVLARDGIINERELQEIDTIMMAKYRPIIAGLYPPKTT